MLRETAVWGRGFWPQNLVRGTDVCSKEAHTQDAAHCLRTPTVSPPPTALGIATEPRRRACEMVLVPVPTYSTFHFFSSVQLSHSVVSDSVTPWTGACQASLSITNSWSLLKLVSIELMMPSNHLILCFPLLLPPSIFPSIRIFSNELVLPIR